MEHWKQTEIYTVNIRWLSNKHNFFIIKKLICKTHKIQIKCNYNTLSTQGVWRIRIGDWKIRFHFKQINTQTLENQDKLKASIWALERTIVAERSKTKHAIKYDKTQLWNQQNYKIWQNVNTYHPHSCM
jgi:hypothetical protein